MASICRCLFQSANFRHHHRFRFPDVRNSAFPDSRLNSIRSHLSLAIIFHASAVSNHNIAFRWSVVQPALLFRGFRLLSCRKWPTTFHTSKTTASASPIHFNPIYGSSDYSALFCFFIITRNHFSRHNRSDRTIYYCDILPKSQNNGTLYHLLPCRDIGCLFKTSISLAFPDRLQPMYPLYGMHPLLPIRCAAKRKYPSRETGRHLHLLRRLPAGLSSRSPRLPLIQFFSSPRRKTLALHHHHSFYLLSDDCQNIDRPHTPTLQNLTPMCFIQWLHFSTIIGPHPIIF